MEKKAQTHRKREHRLFCMNEMVWLHWNYFKLQQKKIISSLTVPRLFWFVCCVDVVVKLVIVQKNYMCIFIKEKKILAARIRHGTVAKKRVRSTRLYSFCMRSLSPPLLSSSHHIIGNPKCISFFFYFLCIFCGYLFI